MIVHPKFLFDPMLDERMESMWGRWLKTLGGWIVRYGPGLVGAILEAKAKQDASKPKPA